MSLQMTKRGDEANIKQVRLATRTFCRCHLLSPAVSLRQWDGRKRWRTSLPVNNRGPGLAYTATRSVRCRPGSARVTVTDHRAGQIIPRGGGAAVTVVTVCRDTPSLPTEVSEPQRAPPTELTRNSARAEPKRPRLGGSSGGERPYCSPAE